MVAASNSLCSLFTGTRRPGKRRSYGVRGKTSATWLQRFDFFFFIIIIIKWINQSVLYSLFFGKKKRGRKFDRTWTRQRFLLLIIFWWGKFTCRMRRKENVRCKRRTENRRRRISSSKSSFVTVLKPLYRIRQPCSSCFYLKKLAFSFGRESSNLV